MVGNRLLTIVFAACLLVFFFMPWFVLTNKNPVGIENLRPSEGNVSGYEVGKYKSAFLMMGDLKMLGKFLKSDTPKEFYLAFLIPALGVLAIVMAVMDKMTRLFSLLAGLAPLAGFGYLFSAYGGSLLSHMTYGGFLTLVAGLGLLVSSVTPASGKKKK